MSSEFKPFVVGITGGSGSGKTFFMEKLIGALPKDDVCRISQDNYYKPIHEIEKDDNGVENFDLPETIDHKVFSEHLAALKRGETIEHPEYTFNNARTSPNMLRLEPRPVIIVEGLFIYHYPDVGEQIDLKIFVDAKEHIKIKRRILRDNRERGYDLEDVLYRWEYHISPTFERIIKPLRSSADLIVNNDSSFEVALEVILCYIREKLDKRQ